MARQRRPGTAGAGAAPDGGLGRGAADGHLHLDPPGAARRTSAGPLVLPVRAELILVLLARLLVWALKPRSQSHARRPTLRGIRRTAGARTCAWSSRPGIPMVPRSQFTALGPCSPRARSMTAVSPVERVSCPSATRRRRRRQNYKSRHLNTTTCPVIGSTMGLVTVG